MKNKIIAFMFSFLLLLVSTAHISFAAEYFNDMTEQTNVVSNKEWNVKFNLPLKTESVNSSNIVVTDDTNSIVPVNIIYVSGSKTVTIRPVSGSYVKGKTYYLTVSKGIQTITGKNLLQPVRLRFTIAKDMPSVPPSSGTGSGTFTVALDAGHGGIDPGIKGTGGALEKDIDLAVVLKAGKILQDNGVQVIYTRNSDSVTWNKDELQPRFKIANDANVNYFVSVHCNTAGTTSTGVETYYPGGNTKARDLAVSIDSEISNKTLLLNRSLNNDKVGSTTMYELFGTNAPAVKVYLGFLSNPDEEKKLNSTDFQDKAAQGLASAILKFKTSSSTTTPTVVISDIKDIVTKVNVGDTFALPKTVAATLSTGGTTQVPITWSSTIVDTTKTGTYAFKGRVSGYNRDVILTLLVMSKTNSKGIVALDAGHGGFDPGAIGPSGLQEKDVALSVTLKVGKILEGKGIGVVYTRTNDDRPKPSGSTYGEYMTKDLQSRCDISNLAKVNYFLSIHNNSFTPDAHGTETYYSDGSITGQNFAQNIQSEVVKAIGLTDRGLKTAGYYVLEHTDAPSALVELAFISNAAEEKLLGTDDFQNKCAVAIANAIVKSLGN